MCLCFCIVDHTCSHEEVVADCTKAIKLNPNFVKAYIRRAQAYEQQSKLKDALPGFTFDLSLNLIGRLQESV